MTEPEFTNQKCETMTMKHVLASFSQILGKETTSALIFPYCMHLYQSYNESLKRRSRANWEMPACATLEETKDNLIVHVFISCGVHYRSRICSFSYIR